MNDCAKLWYIYTYVSLDRHDNTKLYCYDVY